ncbi:MAG: protein secretion system (Wss), protein YukD, partial [Thermoleophilaceae bacterium]|nr:protein secretion system (Wss), protein YukD [Thermoleophilaceae bacterium]
MTLGVTVVGAFPDDVVLDENEPVSKLVPELVKRQKLPTRGRYDLFDSSGRILHPEVSLAAAGVQNASELRLHRRGERPVIREEPVGGEEPPDDTV